MRRLSWIFAAAALVVLLLFVLADGAYGLAANSVAGNEGASIAPVFSENDYIPRRGPCRANSSSLRSWVRGAIVWCTGGKSMLPSATSTPCAVCPPGVKRQGKKASISECSVCAIWECLDVSKQPSICVACPAGSSALPVLALRNVFDSSSGNVSALPRSHVSLRTCSTSVSTSCTTQNGMGFELVASNRGGGDEMVVGLRPSRKEPNASYSISTFAYSFEALSAGWVELTFVLQRINSDGNGSVLCLQDLEYNRSLVIVDGTTYDVRDEANTVTYTSGTVYSIVVPFAHTRSSSPSFSSAASSEHTLKWMAQDFPQSPSSVEVVMLSMVVSANVSGSVEGCEPCPAVLGCPPHATRTVVCTPGTYLPAINAQRCLPCRGNTYSPGYGFRGCLLCEYGRTANDRHTACSDTCIFTFEDVVYNFTAMAGVVLNPTVGGESDNLALHMSVEEADVAGIDRVYFSLCGELPIQNAARNASSNNTRGSDHGHLCVAEVWNHNSCTSAYVCESINATVGRHFGNAIQFTSVKGGRGVVTSMGSPVAPVGNRASATSYSERTWRAVIRLECSSDVNETNMEGALAVDEVGADHLALTWRSAFACPLCTEKSFTRTESQCNASSMHIVEYSKRSSTSCSGGYAPPPPSIVYCTPCLEAFYTLEWHVCDAATRSQVGFYILKPEHEGCTISDSWQPQNQTRSCSVHRVDISRAQKLSVFVGMFELFVICGLVAMVLRLHYSHQEHRRTFGENTTELDTYNYHSSGIDGLQLHYNVADAIGGGEAEAQHVGEYRFSGTAGRLIHSIKSALQPFGAAVVTRVSGRRSYPLSEAAHGNGYNSQPGTNDTLFVEDSFEHPSQVSGRRNRNLFALDEDDDEDILPPSPPQ